MDNLNQLVEVIELMKDAKKHEENQNNPDIIKQERFYTTALLKTIFGENMNLGVLNAILKDIKAYLFDPNTSISVGKQTGRYGVTITGTLKNGDKKHGIIVANIDDAGNIYRGDVSLQEEFKKVDKYDFVRGKDTSYSFSGNELVKETPLTTTEMLFDENGIENSRSITEFENISKSHERIFSKTTIERDSSIINVVHVNMTEKGKPDRKFDAQIIDNIFSLISVEEGHTFGIKDDVQDLLYEYLDDNVTYKYFPELKDAVLLKMKSSKKR